MQRAIASLLVCFALPACFGGDSNVTESGKGLPEVTVEFPEKAPPGSVQTAVITVENAGPGEMRGILVTFSLVGNVETAIVGFGVNKENPAIVSVEPEPEAVSEDAVVYHFNGLDVGESTTISFELQIPEEKGPAANAVIVSDSQELDRAKGVRLQTLVRE